MLRIQKSKKEIVCGESMVELFDKVDSVLIRNAHDHWKNPLVNKYFGDSVSDEIEGYLVLRKGKKAMWLSHPFNYSQVKKQFGKTIIVKKYSNEKDFKKFLGNELGKKVGFDARFESVSWLKVLKMLFKKKKFVDVSEQLVKSRIVKNKSEIVKIEKAVRETENVLSQVKGWLKKGKSEIEIKERVEREFKSNGFETAFCIVAFGTNTSNIHHISGNKKFTSGAVMIDVGAKYKGYCADVTKTFWIGKENAEFEKKYAHVESTLDLVESLLMPGTFAKDLAEAVKPLKMPHALGHGIGLEVHDFPTGISKKAKWKLEEGMVLAIEPGIYTKKFGIRIENDYLITKSGFKQL